MDTKPLKDTIQLNKRDNYASNVIIPLSFKAKELACGSVYQNDHKMIVFKLLEYDNDKYVDLREYNRYGKETAFTPTKKGVQFKASTFKDEMIDIFNRSLKYC